jgi:hypothetical protein
MAQFVGEGSVPNVRSPVLSKCLQVSAADLVSGPNAVAQLTHGIGKGGEGSATRVPRQMRTAQLVADPSEIG